MAMEIAIEAIEPHPRNSNVMTEAGLKKLERNIERTGRYEPLVVRPLRQDDQDGGVGRDAANDHPQTSLRVAPANDHPQTSLRVAPEGTPMRYQVLNGHHRLEVLKRLGRTTARCEVWEVDDREALLLLATLNRLEGRDDPMRRAALVAELAARSPGADVAALARFLPEDRAALARALELGREALPRPAGAEAARAGTLRPMTFFLRAEEMEVVRRALGQAGKDHPQTSLRVAHEERGRGRAENLVRLAEGYLAGSRSDEPTAAQAENK